MESEAKLARRLGVPVEVGGGTGEAGAEAAVARLLADGATALISFGICGGLDPRLRPGDLVVPDVVVAEGGARWTADPELRARLGEGAGGSLYTGTLVADPKDKRHTHRTLGAVAADVESGAVARAGVPFAVLRAVCDPANRALPSVAVHALDKRGRVNGLRLLAALLRRPGQLVGLVGMARNAGSARRALVARVRALGSLAA